MAGALSPPAAEGEQTGVAHGGMGVPAPNEGAGRSGTVPANGARTVRVLYLFAGARRKSGLARSLRLACKGTGVKIIVEEIDILRGGRRHDLLRKVYRNKILVKVRKGNYFLTAASPPCGSFSRSRSANNRGPRPIRSRTFPRGFPWLQGSSLLQARVANTLVDFTAEVLSAQMDTSPGLTLLEHPEDLGKTGKDVPGSIWQLANIQALGKKDGVDNGAIRQSDFGTAYQKPTRLLGRLPGLAGFMFAGWPSFDEEGYYSGPLPKFLGTAARLIGRKGGAFQTTDTAAWPDRLCHLLARLTLRAVCNSAQAEALTNGVGDGVADDGGAGEEDVTRLPQSATTTSPTTRPDTATRLGPGVQVQWGDLVRHAEPRGPPKRRKITQAELDTLAKGGKLEDDVLYVGRGGRGVPPSKWGNPFKIGTRSTSRRRTCPRTSASWQGRTFYATAARGRHATRIISALW